MANSKDWEILYEAYKRYLDIIKAKKPKVPNYDKLLHNLMQQIDKKVFYIRSSITLQSEKDRLLMNCKQLYHNFATYKALKPQMITPLIERKVDDMLVLICQREGDKIAEYRKTEPGTGSMDLKKLLTPDHVVRQMVQKKIVDLVHDELYHGDYTEIKNDTTVYYITRSGGKYHLADCPFCKGKNLIPTKDYKLDKIRLQPCKCVTNGKNEFGKKNCISVFIDESVRTNPWSKIYHGIDNNQLIYSYIVYKGKVENEQDIQEDYIIDTDSGLLRSAANPTSAAIETIGLVLMRLSFRYGIEEDVVIYTDNMEAMNKWNQDGSNIYLAHLFNSVTVHYIPREKNTKADAIGRKMAYLSMPEQVYKEMIRKLDSYDMIEKEMNYVRQYFDHPRIQIPNLIHELELIAGKEK